MLLRTLNRFQIDSGEEREITLEVMERIKETAIQLYRDVYVMEHGHKSRIDRIYTWGSDCGWNIFVYSRDGKLYVRRSWEYSIVDH